MRLTVLAVLAAGLLAPSVYAAESAYVDVSGGVFDINDNYESTNFAVEYRGANIWKDLLPVVGFDANSDGGYFGYAGFHYDWQICPHFLLVPGLAVSAYHQGNSRDLGGAFEFREQLEADYLMDNQQRIGISVSHMSNAEIYDENPGTETVMLHYSVPVSFFK